MKNTLELLLAELYEEEVKRIESYNEIGEKIEATKIKIWKRDNNIDAGMRFHLGFHKKKVVGWDIIITELERNWRYPFEIIINFKRILKNNKIGERIFNVRS